jgi:hypothetical protein
VVTEPTPDEKLEIAIKHFMMSTEPTSLNVDLILTISHGVKALREENARLKEALTPTAWTKGLYIGEFEFMAPSGRRKYAVPWDTIKEIMAKIRFTALGDESPR